MFSTRRVLDLLRAANPERRVSEDQIRSALRRERLAAPASFAGRFIWSPDDVKRLAMALAVRMPEVWADEKAAL